MAATLIHGRADVLPLADGSVHCIATSPPYYALRDYPGEPLDWPAVSYSPMPGLPPIEAPAMKCKLGLERTPEAFVAHLVHCFREFRRVLRDDGTCWVNLGDSYSSGGMGPGSGKQLTNVGANMPARKPPAGLKPKNLLGIPWRVAFALQADGWVMRSDIVCDIIWAKPNPMPESVTDRPSKAHEYVFLLGKTPRYYYDQQATKRKASREPHAGQWKEPELYGTGPMDRGGHGQRDQPDRIWASDGSSNMRSVLWIATQPTPDAHFATWAEALVTPMILAGTSKRGCCPACGAQYVRVVERDRQPTRPGVDNKINRASAQEDSPYNDHHGMVVGNRDPKRHVTKTKTTGWKASCSCNAGAPVPSKVLDPFCGSGTTGKVAALHGRDFIGVDLNREYLDSIAEGKVLDGERPHRPKSRRPKDPEADPPREDLPGQKLMF
jgi:DNA modification methylase